ncbi:MAG TPA: sigma-70 family RNA polymerase sigma factor [Candidatus Dormibacteraeota bacterium]|nr:sigma-70 family RNA polymerase sigma factor [Candidatus Dormibacteraeota bacterium]
MSGAKPAFEDLYREYVDRIYAFLRSQLGSTPDAEDVTSQVFMKAFEAYSRFEPRHASPAAWLFQIARNAALDHHRRARRLDRTERALAREPAPSVDPGTVAQERMIYRELMEAVARLPDRHREVIGLRHSGLSFQEVGGVMGCSEDAAKMLYHRALKALRAAVPEATP